MPRCDPRDLLTSPNPLNPRDLPSLTSQLTDAPDSPDLTYPTHPTYTDVKYAVDKDDLVERRRRYIQRQIELDKGAVNVKFARPAAGGRPVPPTVTACPGSPSASMR